MSSTSLTFPLLSSPPAECWHCHEPLVESSVVGLYQPDTQTLSHFIHKKCVPLLKKHSEHTFCENQKSWKEKATAWVQPCTEGLREFYQGLSETPEKGALLFFFYEGIEGSFQSMGELSSEGNSLDGFKLTFKLAVPLLACMLKSSLLFGALQVARNRLSPGNAISQSLDTYKVLEYTGYAVFAQATGIVGTILYKLSVLQ